MKKDEVIEVARQIGAIPVHGAGHELAIVRTEKIEAFANEVERRTLERAAEVAKPHWRIAENIRALKEEGK